MAKDVGSFLIALSDGTIQLWSHHPKMTSLMTSFNAIHMAGDQVTAMATDKENFYLFTGSTHGYVKIWVIADYWYVIMSLMIFMSKFPLISAYPLAEWKNQCDWSFFCMFIIRFMLFYYCR